MTTVIMITNSKGGVLKTTTAVTVAHRLAHMEARVVLVDADPQGNLATMLGLDPGPNFAHALFDPAGAHDHLVDAGRTQPLMLLPGNHETKAIANNLARQLHDGVITRAQLADMLRQLAASNAGPPFDYLVVDTPPSGVLQELALLAADAIVIPVALDYLAMEALTVTLATLQALDKTPTQLLILPTMYDARSAEAAHNLSLLTAAYPGCVRQPVPYCAAARTACAEGKTVWEYRDRRSRTLPAMRAAYEQLAHWIVSPPEDVLFGPD